MSKKKFIFLLLAVAAMGLLWENFSSIFVKPPPAKRPAAPARQKISRIACSVSGEVKKAGIYYLSPGALVCDLIDAAGGLTSSADSGNIQMDDFLEDRESIVVPKKSFFKKIGVGQAPEKTYFLPPMKIVEEK